MRRPHRFLTLVALGYLMALDNGATPSARAWPAAGDGPTSSGIRSSVIPFAGVAASAAPPAGAAAERWYIVVLDPPALAAHSGELPNAAPGSPAAAGRPRLDSRSAASRAWLAHLRVVQDAFLARMSARLGRPVSPGDRYTHALDGFSVRLTPTEADRLRGLPDLRLLQEETWQRPATDAGPRWSGAGDLWNGTASGGRMIRGEGQIVGIIDTGINIDHPSFAAVAADGYEHRNPRSGYLDWCDPKNPNFDSALACNDKLIGLWSHPSVRGPRPKASPEDENGHGSHTASTAAGNPLTAVLGHGGRLERAISGVAPRANLVAYDACSEEGCPDSATLAAIEQATRDGVDVINYSITTYAPGSDDPSTSPWHNAVNLAFLGAREAGVTVVVAAGNAGSGPGTLSSDAPWTLTVANSSHNRAALNGVADLSGGGSAPPGDLAGRALSVGYGPAPIRYAKGVSNAKGEVDAGLCAGPFAPGTWKGEIILCDRGVVARVAKGANVLAGGAGGMILANLGEGENLAADDHALPASHVGQAAGDRLRAWLADGDKGQRGRIVATTFNLDPANGDILNSSSSRGPAFAAACCRRPDMQALDLRLLPVMKPDLSAPGSDIIAAVASAPELPSPEFGLMSGTSMASPHVAGAAALLRQAHPEWSPAELQSALVLAARDGTLRKEDRQTPADRHDVGGGHLDAGSAAGSGLVLDVPSADMRSADPDAGGDPGALNLPGLLSENCVGTCRWERTVKAVLGRGGRWTAVGQADGLTVTVEPSGFSLAPGETQRLTITARVQDGDMAWRFGRVLLQPAGLPEAVALHLPLAAHTAPVAGPHQVLLRSAAAAGQERITIQAAHPERVQATGFGLTMAQEATFSLPQAPSDGNPFAAAPGRAIQLMTVPVDAARVVVETTGSAARDVDLWLGQDADGDGLPIAGELRCHSQGGSWRELCEVLAPKAGPWWAIIENAASGSGAQAITLSWAVVDGAPRAGKTLTVATVPDSAGPHSLSLDLGWQLPDITPGRRYYGAIGIGEAGTAALDMTLIPVDLVVGDDAVPTPDPPRATATAGMPAATATPGRPPATTTPRSDERLWLPFLQDPGARP